jgi:stage IV sporulation protein FB
VLLGEPARTQFDLDFSVMGFQVRISVWFWAIALLLGAQRLPERPDLLFIWTAVLFGSILLHELGHALAFRHYGIRSHIVLYHMGGLAVPDGAGYGNRRTQWSQVIISAAGPGIQLALAAVVILLLRVSGHAVHLPLPPAITDLLPEMSGTALSNVYVAVLVNDLIFVNILWAIFNLLPVYPLDGGQISRELFMMKEPQQGIKNSLILSMITCGVVVFWGFTSGDRFLPIMFIMLGFQNYQIFQAYTGRGGGYGGGQPW